MVQYLLGIDVGSSDCKVILIDTHGAILCQYGTPYKTSTPQLNWAEQNPEDWVQAAYTATRYCLEAAAINPVDVVGIAVDGPAHNVALMNHSGEILRPTIHWSDLRSVPQAEYLQALYGEAIFRASYCRVNPAWTLPQLLWLKEHEPSTWANLRRILVTKDYVRYRLTGVYQTDVYDAIGTQLYGVEAGEWSQFLCDLIGFNRDYLPPVMSASAISGPLLAEPAAAMGLVEGIPVAVGSGDSVVEAVGIGASQPGHCMVKLGTAANVNCVMQQPFPTWQSITYPHVVEPHWFTITATNSGASTMRWFRDTFCRLESQEAQAKGLNVHDLIDMLAEDAPPGSDGLLFHPYLKGERSPYWDPHLRGDFIGINTRNNIHHFARAVLEGVAYSIRDCLQVVQQIGQPITRYSLIGGGSRSHLWRQILADVLGEPLEKPRVESAAFGSALLAGVAVGVYSDSEMAVQLGVEIEETILPDPERHQMYNAYFEVYQAITGDLSRHFHQLVEITNALQHQGALVHED